MSEGEPRVSQAQSEIDAHLAARAEKNRQDLLDDLLIGDGTHQESFKRPQEVKKRDGTSYVRQIEAKGKPLTREEQEQRVKDASDYYAHLENISHNTVYDEVDLGRDDGVKGREYKAVNDYDQHLMNAAHAEALVDNAQFDYENAHTEALIENAKFDVAAIEAKIEADPKFRRLVQVVDRIKEFRSHVVSESDNESTLQADLAFEEKRFQELFDKYESEGADHAVLEYILDGVYSANAESESAGAINSAEVAEGASPETTTGNNGEAGDARQAESGGEAAENGMEINKGDKVQYTDKQGNVVEGTVLAVLRLDNEDYDIYHIAAADGRKPYVSYAQLIGDADAILPVDPNTGQGLGAPAKEGDSKEEYETRETSGDPGNELEETQGTAGVDLLDDIELPPDSAENSTGNDPEVGELQPKSKWEKFKDVFRPSYWAAKWSVVEAGIISKGTDPEKSEAENKAIEERNRRRLAIGKTVALIGVGVAAGMLIKGAIDGDFDGSNVPEAPAGDDLPPAPDVDPGITQYDNISILDNEGGVEAIQRLYGANEEQARAIWDQVYSQFGTNALDHSSVGGGMMPDIIEVGGGNYGWSHEGLLSADMTNALNNAAESVIG